MFLKLGAEPVRLAFFNNIKENIISRDQLTPNLYVNFNMVMVLNDQKLPLNLPLYMQDIIIYFINIRKGKKHILSRSVFR